MHTHTHLKDRAGVMKVELLRRAMERRGLPPDTSLHTFPKGPKIERGGCLIVAKAASANFAVLSVILPVVGGKLGLSLREGEHGVPTVGRGGAGGLLEVGDQIIAVNEHENLQHLGYAEIVELARSIAVQSPPGGHIKIGIVRPHCLRLPVARDVASKVVGTGGQNLRMLTNAVGVPLILLGPENLADTTSSFQQDPDLLVCSADTSIAAIEAQDLLISVTTGGLFVLRGIGADDWIDYGGLRDIEERYGTKIWLEWETTTAIDPGAKPVLKVLLQPISGRKVKIRQVCVALVGCHTSVIDGDTGVTQCVSSPIHIPST